MVATQHNNMVAAQNMVQTLLGTVNSTNGQEGKDNNTSHKPLQRSVRVSMIESLNEVIEITVHFVCLLGLVPVASCNELKRGVDPGMFMI
jgi:hypothetical protein